MPKILRAVIDTNHIISAILSSRGASAKLINWMTREEDYFRLLLSEPIWEEYSAAAGNADYLVTKNIRHFPQKKFRNVRIVRIKKFLDVLEEMEKARAKQRPKSII